MLKFATTHHQMTMKLKYQPISKNVKKYSEGKDMRQSKNYK